MLHLQGIGRHRPGEIYAMARHDLAGAWPIILGDRPFLMGEQLTTIDAVAYAFLANVLYVPFETELKRIARGLPDAGHLLRGHGAGAAARDLSSGARDAARRLGPRIASVCDWNSRR